MKSTSRFSLLIAAGLMFTAAASACWQRLEPAFAVVAAAYRKVKDWVLDGFKMAGGEGDGFARPAMLLKQAKAFVQRLVKRQRPEVTGSWRMCPST